VRRVPGRLLAALALAAFIISGSWAQTGRVGCDGTWAGGWDKGNGVQLVFAGETLIAFYWRGDYQNVARFTPSPDGRDRSFAWARGEATLTRAGNEATLMLRERGKPELSVSLKRE